MKIVFCYQFCTLGGCETVLSTRMHELESLGVDAHAIFFAGGEGEELFSDLGDRVKICRNRLAVQEKLAAVKPDFLISLDTPQIVRYLEDQPSEMKLVFEVHSTYPDALEKVKHLKQHRLSALLTPSHAQRDLVKSILGEEIGCPVKVVPNPLRRNFGEGNETQVYRRPIVLWVGRLDPHKNWRAYVEICRDLRERNSEIEYWIVGTTKISALEKAQLWEEVKKAGIVDRFRWLPHVQYDKMDRLFRFVARSGGCLVSTSRQESFGMAAAEAMASSCPVVVPDIGGFRDFVIDGETGFRYPPGQLKSAVQYILKSIENLPVRRKIVAAGFDRVQGEYSARTAVLKLIDTLENLSPAKVANEPETSRGD
jgi:glycosyltransferase involved in cell wall biosynthesis